MSELEKRLTELGIVLPTVSGPFGAYVPAKRVGNLIFVAGQLPMRDGALFATGPVPGTCTIEQAREGAKVCVINAFAAIAALPGGLEQLAGVVRVGVFVQSDPGFSQQPQIANAASELLLQLFGDAGKHVRAAVGVNALPLGAAVEIEFVFQAV